MKKTSKRTGGSRKRSRKRPASARELALVAFAAVARGKRWYVFGAQAVNLYGFPRMTADIDIKLDLGKSDVRTFVAAVEGGGFDVRIRDAEFIAQTRVIPIVHRATRFPIDVVLAGPGLEQLFLQASRTHRVRGHDVPVIAPEHLIVTKLIAARAKDIEDVRELLAIAKLDLNAIDALLAQVEDALRSEPRRAR